MGISSNIEPASLSGVIARGRAHLVPDHGGVESEHVPSGKADRETGLVLVLFLLGLFPVEKKMESVQ